MPDENNLVNIEPETREETFLQDIADGTQTLTPAVRKEEFLRRIAAKPGVPSITESDEGKVLTVDNGEAVWGEASSLPEITAQDEGKILTVDNGAAVWGEGGGGGGFRLVGANALADMADAPDGTTTDSLYDDGGSYYGIVTLFGNIREVSFAIEYPESDQDSPVIVQRRHGEDGDDILIFPRYFISNEPFIGTPVTDDPQASDYYLTPEQNISVKTSSIGQDVIIVVPFDTTFKWVRYGGVN